MMETKFETTFLKSVKKYASIKNLVRKKGDNALVACSDCRDTPDNTLKFVLLGPHDVAYGI